MTRSSERGGSAGETRRIRARWAFGGVAVAAAVLFGVQACAIESPETLTGPVVGSRNAPASSQISDTPSFTRFTKAPQLTNRQDVGKALESNYPPLLRTAGVSGKADIWVRINAAGVVEKASIHGTSGHEALDQAALRVGMSMRFTPAEDNGVAVPVWVSLPITFQYDMPARR